MNNQMHVLVVRLAPTPTARILSFCVVILVFLAAGFGRTEGAFLLISLGNKEDLVPFMFSIRNKMGQVDLSSIRR